MFDGPACVCVFENVCVGACECGCCACGWNKQYSVARLGHTGARALATRGRAPPVQVCIRIIGADSIVVDRESGTKQSSNRTAQYRFVYPQNYESRTLTVHEFTV